jgi:hypothetical protein
MSQPALDRVRVIGPLAGFADGYRAELAERGYSLSGAAPARDASLARRGCPLRCGSSGFVSGRPTTVVRGNVRSLGPVDRVGDSPRGIDVLGVADLPNDGDPPRLVRGEWPSLWVRRRCA